MEINLPGDDGSSVLKDVAGRGLVAAVDQLEGVDRTHLRLRVVFGVS